MEDQQQRTWEQQANSTRLQVLQMIVKAGSGHLASGLGTVEIFQFFYQEVLRVKPEDPTWEDRDLFLLSAGHLCPTWYATLANQGFFPQSELMTLRQFGSPLQGHPHRNLAMGIENTSGPLGQGVSMAVGLAYGLQQAKSQRRVFVLTSDGEQQEGQAWEAYLFAAHYNLKNLTVIVDVNGIQASGPTKEVMKVDSLKEKFLAFNWAVGVADGNDHQSLQNTWQQLQTVPYPKVLLAKTIPGKGVGFMENDYHFHGKTITGEQLLMAQKELEEQC